MLCKVVRKSGNGSLLWPEGCETIEEVPYDLVKAIEHAFRILDWHENLPKEEIPPVWMWAVGHEIEYWFEEIERKREEEANARSSGDKVPEVGMMSNELADQIRNR
jgi:hypothetical protein